MTDYLKLNKKWWNNVTAIHSQSELYNLKAFKKGKTSLQEIEIKELGNVKGKTLLHLMCHFGMDTLSWAREGAVVTGVDISDTAIQLATSLSKELHIPATFVCSDVYDVQKKLDKKFDIIFMSYGVLLWLSDIKKWAKLMSGLLNKNGVLYIVELHPFTDILSYDFKITYDYFNKGPHRDDSAGTYTDLKADIQGVTYQWSYTMSDIINSLIQAGLKIDYLHEFPYTMYDQFPGFMKKNKKGQYVFKDENIQIPLLFSLQAKK
jgi:2-polyprenyl-3-methyl-5-hydroxy-6-metoxy-1,4-benzoquinol methylase